VLFRSVLALIAGRWLVPESRDPSAPRLDVAGFVLSIAGLTALTWGLIEAPSRGWTDAAILAAFAAAAVALAVFVALELRTGEPMLDVRLFRNPRFSASSAAISLAFFALFGMIFFLTQYLQDVLGYSALEAGVRTMPVAAGLLVGGPSSAKLAARIGAKRVVAGGLAIVAAGLYLLSTAGASSGYGLVATALVLLGFGMANAMAPATDAIMGSLPEAKMSVGSAVNDTTRTAGGTLGVAVLGSLLSSGYREDMDAVTAHLPAPAREAANDSIAGAIAVADRIGDSGLASAAQDAFLSGMHTTALVAAGIALAGALVALAFLPSYERAPEPVPA